MMRNLAYISGIPVDLISGAQLLELITGWLSAPEKSRHIITLNAIMLVSALKKQHFKDIIKKADLVTVDGYGIALILQKKGYQNSHHLRGVDLTRELLQWCSINQRTVYFYGGTPRVAELMKRLFPIKWPQLFIRGIRDGYHSNITRFKTKKEIIERQPDLLLVGLGSPEQELFLVEILPHLKKTLGIGVGGTFEILTGCKREAPEFIRNHGWEWCFRMIQDPRRIKLVPDLVRFWYRFLLKKGER